MPDVDFQKLSTVQSDKGPGAPTIASTTAAIAPNAFFTFISGTAALTTITPPVSGPHMLCLVFTNAAPAAMATTGNIVRSSTLTRQNVPYLFVYDPQGAKYYVEVL